LPRARRGGDTGSEADADSEPDGASASDSDGGRDSDSDADADSEAGLAEPFVSSACGGLARGVLADPLDFSRVSFSAVCFVESVISSSDSVWVD
jgi:hypothetical protein